MEDTNVTSSSTKQTNTDMSTSSGQQAGTDGDFVSIFEQPREDLSTPVSEPIDAQISPQPDPPLLEDVSRVDRSFASQSPLVEQMMQPSLPQPPETTAVVDAVSYSEPLPPALDTTNNPQAWQQPAVTQVPQAYQPVVSQPAALMEQPAPPSPYAVDMVPRDASPQQTPVSPWNMNTPPSYATNPFAATQPQPAAATSWTSATPYQNRLNPGIQGMRTATMPSVAGMAPVQPMAQPVTNPYAFITEQGDTYAAPPQAKPKGLVVALAVLGILLLIGLALYVLLPGGTRGDDEKPDTSNSQGAAAGPSLNLALQEPQYKDEVLVGVVGGQLSGSDGAAVMVTSVDRDYTPETGAPKTSSELVKVDLLVGNADKSQPKVFKSSEFVISSLDGVFGFALDDLSEGAKSVSLNPGMKGKLTLVYELKPQMTDFVLLYSRAYQDTGIRYTMLSAVGLTQGTASLTNTDILKLLQAAN